MICVHRTDNRAVYIPSDLCAQLSAQSVIIIGMSSTHPSVLMKPERLPSTKKDTWSPIWRKEDLPSARNCSSHGVPTVDITDYRLSLPRRRRPKLLEECRKYSRLIARVYSECTHKVLHAGAEAEMQIIIRYTTPAQPLI